MLRALMLAVSAILMVVSAGAPRVSAQTPTPTPDLGVIYRAHVAAMNAGDTAAALAFLSDDAQVTGPPLCSPNPCVGKAAILPELEALKGLKLRTTIVSLQPAPGNMLTIREEHRAEIITAAGVERALGKVSATFTGSKISRLVLEPDAADPQTATFLNYYRALVTAQQLYEARNRGDMAAAAAVFAEPTDFVGGMDCNPCTTRAGIQAQFQAQFNSGRRFILRDVKVAGATATWVQEVRAPIFAAAGIERIISRVTAELKDGKIVSWRAADHVSDQQTAAWANFQRVSGLVQQLYAARTRGDAAAAAEIFAEPTDFVGGNCMPCTTRAPIQAQFQQQFNNGNRLTVRDIRVAGSTFTWVQEIRGAAVEAAGIERRLSNVTAEFLDGKIVFWRAVDDRSDPQTAAFFAQAPAPAAPAVMPRAGDGGIRGDW